MSADQTKRPALSIADRQALIDEIAALNAKYARELPTLEKAIADAEADVRAAEENLKVASLRVLTTMSISGRPQ